MKTVITCRVVGETKSFNDRQKVFVVKTTGSGRWLVSGKYLGKYRRVNGWVDGIANAKLVTVDDEFAEQAGLQTDVENVMLPEVC